MQKAMDQDLLPLLVPVQLPIKREEVYQVDSVVLNKPRIRILSELPLYHELTAEQLTRILGYSYRYMQDECKKLSAKSVNMLQSVPVEKKPRDARVGNLPYVYVLGTAGRQYLLSEGHTVWPRWRPEEEKDRAGYLHTLAVNDVLINARVLQKDHPGFLLENFVHEREFRSEPIQVTTPDRVTPVNLRPDLWLDLRDYNTRKRYVYSVEVNLTHLDRKRFVKKLRLYLHSRDESYEKRFGTQIHVVIFVIQTRSHFPRPYRAPGYQPTQQELKNREIEYTRGQNRLMDFKQWTEEELTRAGEISDASFFRFSAAPLDTLTPSEFFFSPHFYVPFDTAPSPLIPWKVEEKRE
jgi:hypothetical protein